MPAAGQAEGRTVERKIPEATVSRLPRYLKVLVDASDADTTTISSGDLARQAGVNSAIVRKDLSFLGTYGTRGVGYQVEGLTTEISQVLGLAGRRRVVIVGIGNLGTALASYEGFDQRGFEIAGLLDADRAKVGGRVGDHVIEHIDEIATIVRQRRVTMAMVCTPAERAQQAADQLMAAGITAILNFAPVNLDTGADVSMRTVDLSTELQILSFYQQVAQVRTAAAG